MTHRLTVVLDDQLIKHAKIQAINEDRSVADLITDALTAYLKDPQAFQHG